MLRTNLVKMMKLDRLLFCVVHSIWLVFVCFEVVFQVSDCRPERGQKKSTDVSFVVPLAFGSYVLERRTNEN